MRGSDFEFDSIYSFTYNFNKTSIYRGGSYIDSPKWLKDKKSTINPKNNDHKCFQYAATLALNFDNINNHPEKISKIRPFIDQYNWKDIDFPATSKDWKKIELNNKIVLNILYIPHNTKKIQLAYRTKYNLTYNKQIILLMFTDGEKWHYLVVNNLSRLFRGLTSNHNADFYCLNCFHSYRTKNKLEAHKKICEKHDYCHVEMPIKGNNTIKYNYGEKSIKMPFTIYAGLECLRGYCHYTGKYRGAAHNICNLRYKIPKEIPVVFHNGSTYDYHFIIKELAKEFEGNFECLGENTEKYITFSMPIRKKIENKDLEITYKIKFIDSYRFMSSSLSKLVDNVSEGIHNNKCVDCKSILDYVRITKNEKLLLKCFNCDSYYKKKFNKDLIKNFKNTYSFCDNNLNKFILLLRKGVYPYEYMDSWERFNEISLPSKEYFYSHLNMEDIDDIDYRHGNNVFKVFKLDNLGDYHDLYVKSDTLLLADVFENFRTLHRYEY